MTWVNQGKLALTAAGLIAFGYGVRTDDARFRWLAIALIGAAVVLRFIKRRDRE